ncbi:5-formyltetrahydrofolate cyclo-ligase [Streptomyces milbemycinicus]|uniref:5-formyltetrahydrofolate cyclo-ligase n=1 Tax=Streptomyces milbemycinicus TaxID=476552 RepID=A0ABW8LRL7_9ACTN
MPPVDLIVCGSVAVNLEGVRIGKGAGYSDIEVALLQESGLIGPDTIIATTVHPLQVLDEILPEADHDFRVDLIITSDETIECPSRPRQHSIIWNISLRTPSRRFRRLRHASGPAGSDDSPPHGHLVL